jgi:hypothetical protein
MDVPFILFHFLVDEAHLSVVTFVKQLPNFHMFKTISLWKNMKAYGAL